MFNINLEGMPIEEIATETEGRVSIKKIRVLNTEEIELELSAEVLPRK